MNPRVAKSHRKLVFASMLLISLLTILSIRVVSLQWLQKTDENVAKKRSHTKTEIFPAYRGIIVDRNDETLVVNIPLTNIYADKYHLDDPDTISWGVAYKQLRHTEEWLKAEPSTRKKLLANKRFSLIKREHHNVLIQEHYSFIVSLIAKPLKIDKQSLFEKLQHPRLKRIPIVKNLNEDDSDYIERILKENYIRGFSFDKRLTRHYSSPTLATHLVGFTKDYQGHVGIESHYDEQLKGADGYHKRISNPNNQSIYSEDEEIKLPQSGLNLQLTLDMTLQSIVEEELDFGLLEADATKGCMIMMQPKTGEILAMASRPHFNLNTKENIENGSSNYIFKQALEPGSTLKMITAAAAMNEGLVNSRTPIFCGNGHLKDRSLTLKDHHPYGTLTVAGILAKSSNIGSYKLGRQVGKTRFFNYLSEFGIGHPTPLNWRGEVTTKGTVGKYLTEFASATYGYAISATPMHMAIAYSTLANDGVMMKPYLVKSLISDDGTIISQQSPEVIRTVLKKKVAADLKKALVSVTEKGGTGTRAAVEGYDVAGKTGTTKKWLPANEKEGRETSGYIDGRYICSFAGMMPAKDPEFVCYIVIDDPQTNAVARYGGTLVAPIFARVARRAAGYLNIPPTKPIIDSSPLVTDSH